MRHIDLSIIEQFDVHLTENNHSYSASIIGGAAIMLVANSLRPTGDIDSVILIPDHIKEEIAKFARKIGIVETWFNDNASRNIRDFIKENENVFVHLIFSGQSLKIYTPSMKTLLISKIYPILDRADEGKDLQDIENLIFAKVVTKEDLNDAIDTFEHEIRYENDSTTRKNSWEIVKFLRTFSESTFGR
jgi:hypothetical protein